MSTTPGSQAEASLLSSDTAATGKSGSIWPFLLSMTLIAGLAELAYAIIGVSALPVYITNALKLPDWNGGAVAAFYLSEAVFNSPMGTLADKIGRRRLMVIGASLSVFTSVGMSLLRAPHNTSEWDKWPVIIAVLLMRIIDGLGAAMFWPAIFASIGDRIAARQQATAMGTLNITYLIGLSFGPAVGGYLNDALSGKLPIHSALRYFPSFATAAVCFALAGAVAYLVAPRKSDQHATGSGGAEGGASEGSAESNAMADAHGGAFTLDAVKSALKRVPMLMLVAFVTFLGIGLIGPNVKLFAMARFQISEGDFGKLLLFAALPIAALSIPLGHLGDKWGKVRAIHLGMAICASSLWMLLRIHNEWAVVVVGALLGIGFIMAFPAYMALLSDLTDSRERGGVIGAVRMAQGVGAMVGAAAGSPLYRHVGHETPFIVAAGFLTLAFILGVLFIHEPKRVDS